MKTLAAASLALLPTLAFIGFAANLGQWELVEVAGESARLERDAA